MPGTSSSISEGRIWLFFSICVNMQSMPKRVGDLWDQIVDFDNLYRAYRATIKGRRYNPSLLRYTANLGDNLIELRDKLSDLSWTPHIATIKHIYYPKYRTIAAPIPYDRVAFHAIVDVIAPYFDRKFIHQSYACRKYKGTLAAVQEVQRMIHGTCRRSGTAYVLKCDIRHYFASIDHETLKGIVRKTIKDAKVLLLLDRIIDGAEGTTVGLPLGSLTSQLFANVYLDQLDHHLKDFMRVKQYARYMDDFLIVHPSKKYLRSLQIEIDRFVTTRLKLHLNPKTAIFPAKHGVDFCGYRIYADRLLPRKRNIKTARHRLKTLAAQYNAGEIPLDKFKASLSSYLGYTKHCKAHNTMSYILRGIKL